MVEGLSAFLSYIGLQELDRELARASVSNAVVRTSREALNIKGILFYGWLADIQIQNKLKKQEQDLTSLSLFKSADPYFRTKQTQSLQKPWWKCCSACGYCQFFLVSETVFSQEVNSWGKVKQGKTVLLSPVCLKVFLNDLVLRLLKPSWAQVDYFIVLQQQV